jgi:hypothetical protein
MITIDRLMHSALGNRPEAVAAGWGGHWDGWTALHKRPGAAFPGVTNSNMPVASAVSGAAFFTPVRIGSAHLRRVSWLASGMLIVGDVSVLAGQGGGAKTAFAVMLSVALAAGRHWCGPIRLDQEPGGVRVGYISAEEDTNRLGLLAAAACAVLQLDPAERAAVERNLYLHDARASGLMIGEPRPNVREDVCPEVYDHGLTILRNEMSSARPGLLVVDTAASLIGIQNENNNSAVTSIVRRIGRAAADLDCAILLLHHTPKMTRETAAAQRGEATLVRGGGAWANSARVVMSLTSLAPKEGGQFAVAGTDPARVRRLEHVKINDQPQMSPIFIETKSVDVTVDDGTDVSVRAVEFLAAPAAAGGISNALRNVAMKAIDAGTLDKRGARVPLSPPGSGGAKNDRDAVVHVANALMVGTGILNFNQAKTTARTVIEELVDRIGCVIVDEDVRLPKYEPDGKPAGHRKGRGLVCRWDLAPWASSPAPAAPQAPSSPLLAPGSVTMPQPASPQTPQPPSQPTQQPAPQPKPRKP